MLPVPPTTNQLTPSQRLRLMRSTRKLGEVLGTTPILNPSSEASRRSATTHLPSASLSLHHSSSLRRANTSSQRKSKPLPRPLVLSYQSVPAPVTPPRSPPAFSPLSPTAKSFINRVPSSSSSLSHYPDQFYEEDPLQARRKRMAKLTRTLGENIPPELVNSSRPRLSRPRSYSGASVTAAFTVAVVPPPSEPNSLDDEYEIISTPVPPLPPKNLLSVSKSSSSLSRSSSLQVPSSPSLVSKRVRGRLHERTSSLGLHGLHLQKVEIPPPLPSLPRKSSDTMDSATSSESADSVSSEPTSYHARAKRTYRKQAGWSGEWNQDMQEVMNRLRGLKA